MMGKQFVETRPMDFINYFQHETLLTPTDFDEWAKTVAGEIEISFSEQEKQEVEKLLTKMKSNCVNCNDVQGKWIGDFIDKVATNVAMVYPEE